MQKELLAHLTGSAQQLVEALGTIHLTLLSSFLAVSDYVIFPRNVEA